MNHTDEPLSDTFSYRDLTLASLKGWQRPALLVALAGIVLAGLGAFLDREQFWQSYLLAFLFWLQLALGCLGLVMVHHLVGGRWSALVRRLLESGALTLPLLALLAVPLVFGLTTLYPWTDAEHVAQSELLQQKTLYLNTPFFLARSALYLGVWVVLALLLNRWSRAQDRSGDPQLARRMSRLSAIGIILFVLTSTFAAYDWMMALEPEWFSSIYGLIVIAGQGLAALALAIQGLRYLADENGVGEGWANNFNDLGNLLLGFVMVWAYFAFSQFLIIWSANIPEEAVWYYHRSRGGWQFVGLVLIAFHFALPFFVLLSRTVKRRRQWLGVLAVLILVMRWVDLYWLIRPAFYPEGVHLHWLDLVLLMAMGGIWIALFVQQWTGHALVPRHDPRLGEETRERHDELATAT